MVDSEYDSDVARRASESRADRAGGNQAAIRLLRSWLAEAPTEGEHEASEQVKRALDGDRGPGRQLFSDG